MRRMKALFLALVFCVVGTMSWSDKTESRAATKPSNPRKVNGEMTWDCVYFGNYQQSDVTGKKKEPIKWRVLSVKGNEALLLADKNLDVKPFNETYKEVTWDTCTLRSWLNGYSASYNIDGVDYSGKGRSFYQTAFNKSERNAILTKELKNKGNGEYWTKDGKNTKDPVFLLSVNDVTNSKYGFIDNKLTDEKHKNKKTRYGRNTNYANSIEKGFKLLFGDDFWWLRDTISMEFTGSDHPKQELETFYLYFALTDYIAFHPYRLNHVLPYAPNYYLKVNFGGYAVRPSIYINLNSSQWTHAGTVNTLWKTGKVPAPDKVSNLTVTNNNGKVIAKWKKGKGIDGYQFEYARNKKFTKKRKAILVKRSNIRLTKINKGKTYYFRVRAYTQNGKSRVFGRYGKLIRIKT